MRTHTKGRLAYNWATKMYDCHFIRNTDDTNTPPRIRSHYGIRTTSVQRFLRVSGGYFNADSTKGQSNENE